MATIIKPQFREAARQQAKACIAIDGLSGTGKSGLALLLAYALAGEDWTKVFACDTENRSLDLFQGIATSTGLKFEKFRKFDLLAMHGYSPTNYLAIKAAAKANGAKAFINDSASHMWQGAGGILSMVSDAKAKDGKMDNYRVWGLPEIKREKDAIVDCLRDSDVHMISTIRVKEKFEFVNVEGKGNSLQSLGEQQIQMPDLKYEPDLILTMEAPGSITGKPPVATVTKSRYAIFEKGQTYEFTQGILNGLRDYLAEGADPEKLKESQRLELLATMKEILNTNVSAATLLPILKEQLGKKDVPLEQLDLHNLRALYQLIIA